MSVPTFTHDETGTSAAHWRAHAEWEQVPDLEWVDAAGGPVTRVVVVAAHPDDESLGAAGLMATAYDRGVAVQLVLATLGERSHPRSVTVTPEQLASMRQRESTSALAIVAPDAPTAWAELPDGQVAGHGDELTALLVEVVGDGRGTLVVAPWRHDGHPDHEAAGRAAATAAARTGARCLEYPVWAWHWRAPDDLPWTDLRSVPLDDRIRGLKQRAIGAHRSQVEPLSALPGDEVLLTASVLAHFDGAVEMFVEQLASDDDLDRLHASTPDPWGVDSRWYERRKRDLLLAVLPRQRFERAWEVGCSTGALAHALAARCDEVVATDTSAAALERARRRETDGRHIEWELGDATRPRPGASYDLVVVSEVGYFFSPRALDAFVDVVSAALTETGVVLLCHWRHPIVGWPVDGAQVHERLRHGLGLPVLAHYVDGDVEVLLLGPREASPRSDR